MVFVIVRYGVYEKTNTAICNRHMIMQVLVLFDFGRRQIWMHPPQADPWQGATLLVHTTPCNGPRAVRYAAPLLQHPTLSTCCTGVLTPRSLLVDYWAS